MGVLPVPDRGSRFYVHSGRFTPLTCATSAWLQSKAPSFWVVFDRACDLTMEETAERNSDLPCRTTQ